MHTKSAHKSEQKALEESVHPVFHSPSLPPQGKATDDWCRRGSWNRSHTEPGWPLLPAPRPCFDSLVLTAMTWNARGNDSPFVWPSQGTCSADPSTTAHGHLKSRGKKQGALADCSINCVLWSRAASNRGATVTSNSHRLHLFLNWFRRWKRKTHD